MLTISDLQVSYDENIILENLNINFDSGLIHGLVGLNGAGKTTFLNTVYGFKKQSRGEVLLNNEILKRTDISYLETENFFYSGITGMEYLSLFTSTSKSYNTDDWNKIFKLPLNELIESYSTGMKKKLALMAILKQDKNIVILDEPFNGLDIESSKLLSMIVLKLKEKGRTILITSHIIESLTNICDYIHYLKSGTISFTRDKNNFSGIENEIFKNTESDFNELIRNVF